MNGSVSKRAVGVLGLLLCCAVTLLAPTARAVDNETFGMVPHPHNIEGRERRTFGIPLETGAVFEDAVRVYNRTEQPLSLYVYAADAEAGVDGTISVGFRGSRPEGVGAWVKLSRDTINLPPRGEALVRFRIDIRSADPSPDLGAIVIENAERGIAADLAQRLQVVIRTTAPNSPTTSVRVRPLLLRSPWIIVATIGLVVAFVIVWLGARRARRPRDRILPIGGLKKPEAEDVTPEASKPVLRRLGEESQRQPSAPRRAATSGSRGRSASSRTKAAQREELPDLRPMLDEMLAEIDEGEPEPEHVPTKRRAPAKRSTRPKAKTARTKSGAKTKSDRGYIPLDKN